MNGLIAWWARNSVAANLLMIALFAGGVYGYFNIEREVFPSVEVDAATVSITWQGAAPQEVEEQIILRVEEAVSDIDGLKEVSAVAREGFASVTVEAQEGVDIDDFVNEVKSRVDGISTFPADAFPPVVRQLPTNQDAIYLAVYGDLSDRDLSRLARDVRDELAQLPNGSPLVDVFDNRSEEVSIEVSEAALQRYGLTFDDVARAVRGTSINRSSGQIRLDTGDVQLRAENLADTRREFEQIIVRQTPDGAIVRVRDVATVLDGMEDAEFIATVNGERMAGMVIRAPERTDVVKLSDAVGKYVEERQKTLPEGATLYLWFDTATLFFARLELIGWNALGGLALVIVVLTLFLRPKVALWVTVGITASFAGAFFIMPIFGVSLNMLSLFAMLLVIGIVVDDAIVVGENIHRQVESGKRGVDAATIGAQLVAKPVFFAVITTMIAFAPWLFIGGPAADFFGHVSLTIVAALTFSLVESFFILPAHLGHLHPAEDDKGWLSRIQDRIANSLNWVGDTIVRRVAKLALRARYFTVSLFVALFVIAITIVSTGYVRFSFFPNIEGNFLSFAVNLPEGTPFSRTEEVYRQVEAAGLELMEDLEEEFGYTVIQSIYADAFGTGVDCFLTVVEADERPDISASEVLERMREKVGDIPDAEDITSNSDFNNTGPELQFGIEAAGLDDLRIASNEIQDYLATIEGVYDISDNLQSATEELRIVLKPGAERLGLTLSEVSRQVRQAFFGEEAQRLPRDGEDVRVVVRYPRDDRRTLDSLQSLRIRTPDGAEVPLAEVADVEYAPSYNAIRRSDRKRSARVSARAREDVDTGPIFREFYSTFVPEWERRNPNVEIRRRGQSQDEQEFFAEISILYLIAFGLMYGLLAIAFNSYWQPVLIMTAIPFGYTGAVFGHLIWGVQMDLFAFFGVGAAAGVVINDNLVLMDFVNRLRAQGVGAFNALVQSVVYRFRPILLTSVTTFIGLTPIMFETSYDAQFLIPTVVSLSFGVMFALFVTLFFVPSMYAVGIDIGRFYKARWTGVPQPAFGEGASTEDESPSIEDLRPGMGEAPAK
ncbi:MAG: efflux RND transporter permease subunit [Pseudomonadota bacterium]